jgi:hypothetical protein
MSGIFKVNRLRREAMKARRNLRLKSVLSLDACRLSG